MKKVLSYLWPQTQKVDTQNNGVLEITMLDGEKVLNSKNANYSYGSLQRILAFGLTKVTLSDVNSTLVLGLGGGCIVDLLRNKFNYQKQITAVELDATVIQIAKQEFGVDISDTLKIEHQDAFEFVKQTTNRYDLLIVDLFIDAQVPLLFYSEEFSQCLSEIINKNGFLIFNLGMDMVNEENRISVEKTLQQNKFTTSLHYNVEGNSTLLIANKA